MSLLDDAMSIASGDDLSKLADLKAKCVTLWAAVQLAKDDELAKATALAWRAEALVAKTPFSRNCCLQAARKWEARA